MTEIFYLDTKFKLRIKVLRSNAVADLLSTASATRHSETHHSETHHSETRHSTGAPAPRRHKAGRTPAEVEVVVAFPFLPKSRTAGVLACRFSNSRNSF